MPWAPRSSPREARAPARAALRDGRALREVVDHLGPLLLGEAHPAAVARERVVELVAGALAGLDADVARAAAGVVDGRDGALARRRGRRAGGAARAERGRDAGGDREAGEAWSSCKGEHGSLEGRGEPRVVMRSVRLGSLVQLKVTFKSSRSWGGGGRGGGGAPPPPPPAPRC